MSDLKLGVIGAGNIAIKHLETIEHIDGLKVVAITSRTIEKAEILANQFKINSVCQNYKIMIEKNKPDALLIVVSDDQIFDVTKKILPYKIPFFIEKPPGITFEQNHELVLMAKKYNVRNMVGFNRRFYSVFRKGLKELDKHGGLLGLIVEGHERFWQKIDNLDVSSRKNYIFSNSPHTFDLLRFFGGEIKDLAFSKSSYKENRGDQFSITIKFINNVVGTYISNWYSPGGWSVRLFGDGITVKFEPLEKGTWYDNKFNAHEIEPDIEDINFKAGFYNQMIAFKNFLKNNELSWPAQNLQDSHNTFSLIKKIVNEK